MKKVRLIMCIVVIVIATLGLLNIISNFIALPITLTCVGVFCMMDAYMYHKSSMNKMALLSLFASAICIITAIFSLYASWKMNS